MSATSTSDNISQSAKLALEGAKVFSVGAKGSSRQLKVQIGVDDTPEQLDRKIPPVKSHRTARIRATRRTPPTSDINTARKLNYGGSSTSSAGSQRTPRYFNPAQAGGMTDVQCATNVRKFKFIREDARLNAGLVQERAAYITAAREASDNGLDEMDLDKIWEFWISKILVLPYHILALRSVVCHHPTSAPAERVFSVFRRLIDALQNAMLEDMLEVSVMGAYNGRSTKEEDQHPWTSQ